MGDVLKTQVAKVFEMMYSEAIRSSDKRIAAVLNSQRNNIRGEVLYRILKQTLIEEPSLENPDGRVSGGGQGK